MKCCQKAYALSSSYAEMKEISKLIERLCTEKEEDNSEYNEDPEAELTYLQRLSRE